jgi:hypothetical protein
MTIHSAAEAVPPAKPLAAHGPDVSALLGDWLNSDGGAMSKGPVRLTVARSETGVVVRATGWGEVPAVVYTAPGAPSTAWSFSAVFAHDGLRTLVSAYHKTGILVATTSTVPLGDGEGPGVWTRSFFHRVHRVHRAEDGS